MEEKVIIFIRSTCLTKTPCPNILFYSILFYSILFYSILFSSNSYAQNNIIGGVGIDISQTPWQVSLKNASNGNSHFCGGSIINEEWILTAAHCIQGISISQIRVHAGSSNQTTTNVGQLLMVAQVIIHPSYNNSTYENDIALLKLQTPLVFNQNVQAIEYANNTNVPLNLVGSIATLTGWGRTCGSCSVATILQRIDIPVISNTSANSLNAVGFPNGLNISNNMIAFFRQGVGVAQGDSGGSAVIYSGGTPILIGCSSWGYPPKDQYPTVYTKIANYANWIIQTLCASSISSLYVSGTSTICSNGSGYYTVSPVPAGATVTWQTTGGLTVTSGQGTPTIGVSATGFGSATIQAIVTTSCGISYPMASFSVFVNAGPGVGINYTSNNGAVQNLLYYYNIGGDVEEEIVNVNVNGVCLGYTSRGYLSYNPSPGTTVTFTAVRGLSLSFRTSRSVFLNLSVGTVGYVRVDATNNCGTNSFLFAFKLENCGTPNPPGNPNPTDPCSNPPGGNKLNLYTISPNPAKEQIKIGISEKPKPIECPNNPYTPKMQSILNSKDGITFSEVNIYNSFGMLVLSKQMDKAKEFIIPLNELRAGLYLVQINEGEYTERHQIVVE